MNGLVDEGLILLGGPIEGEREDFHVIDAPSSEHLRARLAEDPWAKNGMLTVTSAERWTILLAPGALEARGEIGAEIGGGHDQARRPLAFLVQA